MADFHYGQLLADLWLAFVHPKSLATEPWIRSKPDVDSIYFFLSNILLNKSFFKGGRSRCIRQTVAIPPYQNIFNFFRLYQSKEWP